MYVSPARIAHMYYQEGMTQQQIANDTGQSRIRISRLLQQARSDGTVRIIIDYGRFDPDLEQAMKAHYPNTTVIVSDSIDGTTGAITQSIGATAANYLATRIGPGRTVAVGWGTTLRALAEHLDVDQPGTRFVPLLGGQVHAGLDVHANSIAELMAERTSGTALRMFTPAIAESRQARDALVASAAVRETLEHAVDADFALFSLGAPFSASTTITQVGYYTEDEITQLRAAGAECDLISISYFDSSGAECGQELSGRTVSIGLDQLRSIPTKICVAGGPDKHEAVRIALGLGVIDVLVTDDETVRSLVHDARRPRLDAVADSDQHA